MGIMLPFFQSSGKIPVFKQSLNIIASGLQRASPHNLIIFTDMLWKPCALFSPWDWGRMGTEFGSRYAIHE